MLSKKQRFRRWIENNIDRWPDFLGFLMLGVGLIVFISEYFGWSTLYTPFISDLLLRIWPELIGIGLAVIIIDKANELLRRREEKKRLIFQMGSPDNAFAVEAVRQLRQRGWLFDESLLRTNLEAANLKNADLLNANLKETNLHKTNLRGANLTWAKLESALLYKTNLKGASLFRADLKDAIIMGVNLERADLRYANLEGTLLLGTNLERALLYKANLKRADLSRTNLKDAKVTPEQLAEAEELQDAIMPDGSVYKVEDLDKIKNEK